MKQFTMKQFASSALSFALVFSCSSVLFAAHMEESPYLPIDRKSAVVKYSDLNLANPADAEILLYRMKTMASELCKRQGDIRQLNAVRDQKRCVEQGFKKALGAINRQAGVDAEALAARAAGNRAIVVTEQDRPGLHF